MICGDVAGRRSRPAAAERRSGGDLLFRRRAPGVLRVVSGLALAAFLAGCGPTSNNPSNVGADRPRTETGSLSSPPGGAGARRVAERGVTASSPVGISTTNVPNVSAAKTADAFTATATPGSSAYKIGPLDVLDVSVFQVPELTRSVQVADSGTINLPLVGDVVVGGKTAQGVEHELTARLGATYLQSPQVTVYVKEYNSQRVTVEGAVQKPGIYPLRGQSSLLQIIATAQGLSPSSDHGNVLVFRQVKGERMAAKFDVGSIRAGRADDPALQAGDVIVANDSAVKAAWQNLLKALPGAGAFARVL